MLVFDVYKWLDGLILEGIHRVTRVGFCYIEIYMSL